MPTSVSSVCSVKMYSGWMLQDAINLIRKVEMIANQYDAHVALSGGVLYKDGIRKDLDLVFYPHGGSGGMKEAELIVALEKLGFVLGQRYTRVQKALWGTDTVDLIFPHHEGEPGCEIGSLEPCNVD